MRITVGEFRGVDRTCAVTFSEGEFKHKRRVNAVMTPEGGFDRVGTKARAADVGLGVEKKRALGIFDAVDSLDTEE